MPTTQTKTVKSSGGDYSGIIAYEAAEQADLPAGDLIKQAECYTFEDNLGTAVFGTFDGWTTDSTRYIRVYAASGHQHSCKANTGYRIAFDGFGQGFDMREANMRVEGVGFKSFDAGSSPGDRAFHIETAASGDIRISKCWINTFTNDDAFIRVFNGSTSGLRIFNNMTSSVTGGSSPMNGITWQSNGTLYIYSNTLVGHDMPGFVGLIQEEAGFTATVVLKNNLCDRGPNPNADAAAYLLGDATTTGSTNNLSDDATAPGSNAQTSKAPAYVNENAGYLRLASTGSDGINQGADLSADANIAISDDIFGTARPQGASYDIGAAEFPTAALTGTVTASITEADIVAGGKTVIFTLTGDTLLPSTGTPTFNTATPKGTTAGDGRTGDGALTINWPDWYRPLYGHFALIILYSDQGSGSVPTDWSEVTGSPFGAGTEKLQLFYKVLTGSESTPSTTISGSALNMSHCANMAIYTGVGSIGAIGTASNGTGTPMTAGAITTTTDNSIVCACSGRGDNENASGQTFGGSSTGVTEQCDAGTGSGNDSQVSMADLVIATSGSSSGNASATTSATDPWVSVIIELLPSTPFTSARSSIATGLDSAQSEAAGWDAKVKPNIPVANVVRTSDTVTTITLHAQADYDITAQETITWTIPAAALDGNAAIVATPTFTIDTGAAPAASTNVITLLGVGA